jgi:hypothetical protein
VVVGGGRYEILSNVHAFQIQRSVNSFSDFGHQSRNQSVPSRLYDETGISISSNNNNNNGSISNSCNTNGYYSNNNGSNSNNNNSTNTNGNNSNSPEKRTTGGILRRNSSRLHPDFEQVSILINLNFGRKVFQQFCSTHIDF